MDRRSFVTHPAAADASSDEQWQRPPQGVSGFGHSLDSVPAPLAPVPGSGGMCASRQTSWSLRTSANTHQGRTAGAHHALRSTLGIRQGTIHRQTDYSSNLPFE